MSTDSRGAVSFRMTAAAALRILPAMTKQQNPSVESLSFEQALAELEAIVRELENGQGDLDGAISQYERGTILKNHCMKKLEAARMRVEKIMQNQQGEAVGVAPLDEAEGA